MLTRRIPICARRTSSWISTLVDADVYEWASRYNWYRINGYVYRYEDRDGKRHWYLLHREITGAISGVKVDHVNRDTLDNLRSNLRVATDAQNTRNRRGNSTRNARWVGGVNGYARRASMYKGVYPQNSKNTWIAKIGLDGRQIYIGSFSTEIAAARAYNAAARQMFGEYASVNVLPDDKPTFNSSQSNGPTPTLAGVWVFGATPQSAARHPML